MLKHLISASDLTRDDVLGIVRRAGQLMKQQDTVPSLFGTTGVLLFNQPSTRTKGSFFQAMTYAAMDVLVLDNSSMEKNETLRQTLETLALLEYDIAVVRDPEMMAFDVDIATINAGGQEHPTQALADISALSTKFKTLDGVVVNFRGDVERSRVVRSTKELLKKLGVKVVENESLDGCQVVYQIRQQVEQGRLFSDDDYKRVCGLSRQDLTNNPAIKAVLHAGPVMEDVEIDRDVLSDERSLVSTQVKHGLYTRIALIEKMVNDDTSDDPGSSESLRGGDGVQVLGAAPPR